jgi:hypothetical protein
MNSVQKSLSEGFREILAQELFCDVKIHFQNNEIVPIHGFLLASSSQMLKMLLSFHIDSNPEICLTIILPDFQASDFK